METPKPQQRESLHISFFLIMLVALGLFTFGSYVAFDTTNTSETKITGAATADEELVLDSLGTEIGVYKITPSFSVLEDHSILEEYDTLQKDIRTFHLTVEDCVSANREALDSCIQETLEQENYSSWLLGEDCETPEETLFYDFTEMFNQCSASEQDSCTCVETLSGRYPDGEYAILVTQEDDGMHFSLDDLHITLPSLSLTIEGTPLAADTYTIVVSENDAYGSFSPLEPSLMLYLYKEGKILSIESESTFTLYEETRDVCTFSEQPTYKFCKQSSTAVPVYDAASQKTIQQPIVYLFALDFPTQ